MKPSPGRMVFLGTGTGVPSVERASPGILLELPSIRILMDPGPGSLRQLARVERTVTDIDVLLFTHIHPDHSADLVPFLFAGKYPPFLSARKPLQLLAAREFDPFWDKLTGLYGRWIAWPPGLIQRRLLASDRPDYLELPGIHLESRPVAHTVGSLGFRLTGAGGKTLVFSGDTDYCTSLVELADQADWFVCECSFPEGKKTEGHLTPSWAGRIAREARVRRLILNHFYPECEGQDLIGPCAREYGGPITLAEDLMAIPL